MSFASSESKLEKQNVGAKVKKQVKFGYAETKYYEKRSGSHTTEPDIQIVARYEPFAITKTYFKDYRSV